MANLTLTEMRVLVRKGLGGLTASELSNADTDQLLNLALKDLQAEFPLKEKECIVEAAATAGSDSYNLPADIDAIQGVTVIDETSGSVDPKEFKKLKRLSMDEMEVRRTRDFADVRALPEYYTRWEDVLIVSPIPDKAYTIRVVMLKNLALLLEGSVDTVGWPDEWDEILVKFAIAKGHFFNEDYNLEQQAQNSALGALRSAKLVNTAEEDDYRYAGLTVLRAFPESLSD